MGYFDLHSHILFGLDDGSPDLETSLTMVEGLEALGFSHFCATPHQKTGHFLPKWKDCQSTFETLKNETHKRSQGLQFHLGAENMWDETLFERMESKSIPGYDDSSSYLFELPVMNRPTGLVPKLFQQRMSGALPVMAHPERYMALEYKDLVDLRNTVALVVDLGAVAGFHGKRQMKMARKLLKNNVAHAVASDAHTVEDVTIAAKGMEWIDKKCDKNALQTLLIEHPKAILSGTHPDDI